MVPGAGLAMYATLVVYGVELPDLYVELILACKLTLSASMRGY